MTTTTEIKPSPAPKAGGGDPGDCWPPLAHICRKPVEEQTHALCGAKLHIGELPNATKVCEKCVEIARKEIGA